MKLSLNPSRPWRLLSQIHLSNAAVSSSVGDRIVHRQVDINFRPPNTSFVLCPSNGSILRSISMAHILLAPHRSMLSKWCLPPIRMRQILDGGIGEKVVAVQLMEAEVSNRQGTAEVVAVMPLMETDGFKLRSLATLGLITNTTSAMKVAAGVDGLLPSAVSSAGKNRQLFWAWVSQGQIWASVYKPGFARFSVWAAESLFGPGGPCLIGVMSI